MNPWHLPALPTTFELRSPPYKGNVPPPLVPLLSATGLIYFCVPEPMLRPSVVIKGQKRFIVETAVEARAGFLDRPTMVVLIMSTALTMALFAAIYISFFAR
jgi:hypothetical protein